MLLDPPGRVQNQRRCPLAERARGGLYSHLPLLRKDAFNSRVGGGAGGEDRIEDNTSDVKGPTWYLHLHQKILLAANSPWRTAATHAQTKK
jgi:hypothetical protein